MPDANLLKIGEPRRLDQSYKVLPFPQLELSLIELKVRIDGNLSKMGRDGLVKQSGSPGEEVVG